MHKVGVIGFGYIGSVIGATLASRGHRVLALDYNPAIIAAVTAGRAPISEPGLAERIESAVSSGALTISNDVATLAECDVFIIAVGTPLAADMSSADMSHLQGACETLAPYAKPGSLVVVKSTVPPGTCRNMVATALQPGVDVAFCPERLAEGTAVADFERIPIVVGGVTPEAGARAAKFWRDAMGLEVIEVDSAESAELVKLADNLWIDVNIALATEIAYVASALGADAHEVIRAANSLPKGQHHVNIMTPSVGVGGYCLTKDPWFFKALASGLGVEVQMPAASRQINDAVPAHYAAVIDGALGGPVADSGARRKVAVLGIAFKSNTGDIRHTPVAEYVQHLREAGYDLQIHDPLVDPAEAAERLGITLNDSIDQVLDGAEAVLFLAGHQFYRSLAIADMATKVAPGALVFDGQRNFSRDEVAEIKSQGLRYRGVGR